VEEDRERCGAIFEAGTGINRCLCPEVKKKKVKEIR
jgi:hypothetical protein